MPTASEATAELLAHDWTGACRRAAEGLHEVMAQNPTSLERVVETGEIGEGGDRTLVIDAAAEDAVFAELERLHDDGARFTAVSEERGEVDFGNPDHLVVIDPIDGSMNAKRGLGHHALSIAVSTGPTMADVVFGYVYDFGPGEEWRATLGLGAFLNDVPLADAPPERRRPDGRLELVAIESADPKWLAASSDALNEVTGRIRAMGTIAVSLCQVDPPRAWTGWRRSGAAGPSTPPPRSSSSARAAGSSRSPRWRSRSARRWTCCPTHPSWPPARPRPSPSSPRFRAADGRLAHGRAGGGHRRRAGGDFEHAPEGRRRGDGRDRDRARHRLRAHRARRAAAADGGRRPPDVGARANLATMKLTLEPVMQQLGSGPLQSAGGMLVGVEAGGIVGFMGRSVLGQYEIALLDPTRPPRLLLVAPNLRLAAEAFEADEAELLEWVIFHELTHAVQFTGVPWLRDHLAGMLRELLASIKVQVDPGALLRMPSLPSTDDLKGMWDAVREGGLVGAMAGPERKAVIDRLQATMAMIEGHAEHVMDAAGAPVLPSLPKLRASLEKRRREKPPLVKLIEKLLGMDLKMKQYEVGKRFCDAVVRDYGIEGLNRAWFAPELLPTLDELEDPAAWARRTQQRAVTP